jgi:hypothetical protein
MIGMPISKLQPWLRHNLCAAALFGKVHLTFSITRKTVTQTGSLQSFVVMTIDYPLHHPPQK